MCNRYIADLDFLHMARQLNANHDKPIRWTGDIYPGGLAPGLILNLDGERELHPMQFGLAAPWAKEPFDRRYPNNNTRIENWDARTWKDSFLKRRCIIPMTAMHESCWWGPHAGQKVYFKPSGGGLLGVAGIYREWEGDGRLIITMSLMMRPAGEYIMDHGHHRQPFFLAPEGYDDWMAAGEREADESKAVLREHALEPDWSVEIESELKSYKPSTAAKREAKRDEQLEAIATTGPLGLG